MVLYLITSFDIIHKWKPYLTFPEVPWHQCAGYIGSLSAVLTSTALMTWSREGPSWSLDRDVWAVFGLKLRLRLSSSIHDVIADFWRRTSGVRWRLNGMLVFALRCKQDAHFYTSVQMQVSLTTAPKLLYILYHLMSHKLVKDMWDWTCMYLML